MRIAIEVTSTCRQIKTGVSRYAQELTQTMIEMAEESKEDSIVLGFRLSRWPKRKMCFQSPHADSFWIQEPFLPLFLRADIVHGTDMRVPYWKNSARVATIHDIAVEIYPEFSSPRFREMGIAMCKRLAATCHKIITDSESTKRDFLERYDFPPEDVVVVHLGVDEVFRQRNPENIKPVLSKYGLPEAYVLYVGEISWRKNISNMLAAYACSPAARDYSLVMVGPHSFGASELLRDIPALGIESKVYLPGFVSDADLTAIYSGAAAFLFPASYEGFGLPAVEAMASGVPTVVSNRGASPEITGGHAVIVDPDDPDSISKGIGEALEKTPAALEAAQNHTEKFTWQACANATRSVYDDAVAKYRGSG